MNSTQKTSPYRVIAFYKFSRLANLADLRTQLLTEARRHELKGTILIAPEGINSTLAGRPEETRLFEAFLLNISEFTGMPFKESYCEEMPFRRMLVKIKKEIITMRKEGIDPVEMTGDYLDPKIFLEWQDNAKEDLVIVDTRNKYEVDLGTFKGAIDPEIDSFSEFPDWVEQHLADKKEKTIVTFCTGGIRCEKATAHMVKAGFKHVYQLEGGILKYFEDTIERADTNYWKGDCVVFDKRLAVNTRLLPTQDNLCYVCLTKLSEDNDSGQTHPAGRPCLTCLDLMEVAQQERDEKGWERHLQNLKARSSTPKEA